MQRLRPLSKREPQRGSMMLSIALAVGLGSILILGFTGLASSASREQRGARENMQAFYVTEAAVSAAVFDLESGGTGNLGSQQQPVEFGSAAYWVEVTNQGGNVYELVATGSDDRASARIEVTVGPISTSPFKYAAFGDDSLVLDSNAFVDSYDSSVDTYANQKVNSGGGDTWANTNGNIGSNADITMKQNSTVFGDAQPGPTSSATVLGNAYLEGSSTPATAEQDMDPIALPAIASSGDLVVSGVVTLPPGDHAYDSVKINTGGTLVVMGGSTLLLGSLELSSNSEFLVDADAGGVDVYVEGDFVIGSNTLLASLTKTPADLAFHLNSDNVIDPDLEVDLDEIDFNSNAEMYGTIYAPNAAIEVNSNFQLYGAIMAYSIVLDSNAKVHYDESLAWAGFADDPAFETLFWKGSSHSAYND